jgi:WD40 repeat protein
LNNFNNEIYFKEKYICTCLKKHPNHSIFYAQTHGNYIAEFSAKPPFRMNKYKRFETNGHLVNGYSIGFDVNNYGTLLASGSTSGCAYVYNIQTNKLLFIKDAFNKLVRQPCMDAKFKNFNEDQFLAVSSWNGLIKIYEI